MISTNRVSGGHLGTTGARAWAELLIRGSERPVAGGQAPPLVLDANRAFEEFAQVIARDAAPDARWCVKPPSKLSFLTGYTKQDRKPDILFSDPNGKHAVGDAKYKDVLEAAKDESLDTGEKALRVCIKENDWNQLYVYVGISAAAFGFFVFPFWNAEDDEIYWNEGFQFTKPPYEGHARLAVLGLNLLQPLAKVKKKAAERLRNWLNAGAA